MPAIEETTALDGLRRREFARLDAQGHVYLDHAGSALYPASLVRRHAEWLETAVLGNPHSVSPTARASEERLQSCRRRLLQFFRAKDDEYTVIFTANASKALKLVGESYPFSSGDALLLSSDNHNSVNGLREFARTRGARTVYVPLQPPELRLSEPALERHLETAARGPRLFAYPAQSNFSGVQHPLEWVARAQSRGWDVLLDAAAYVPTRRLDLSRCRPDFVALSFYKMFGYPTGVGALLARPSALGRLRRPWFAGGTVGLASVRADRHVPAAGPAAFEDGTVDFTSLPAVERGLDFLDAIGLERIHDRMQVLTRGLIEPLLSLSHGNGRPLVRLHGPADMAGRGGTVAFNLLDADGRVIDLGSVERQAAERRISLRTGCFCNPGAGETALELSRPELAACFDRSAGARTREDLLTCLAPRTAGAVRVSLGLSSNLADIRAFLDFARGFLR